MNRKIIGVTVGTTLNPKKIAGNAEHSHSWNDLTDKPFYEIEGGSVTLTFDGNMTTKENVVEVLNPETGSVLGHYIKLSDDVPEVSQLVGATVVGIFNDIERDFTIGDDVSAFTGDLANIGMSGLKGYYIGESFIAIQEDSKIIIGNELVFTKGIWTMMYVSESAGKTYGKSLTYNVPEIVKQLDMKFIPDALKTHYVIPGGKVTYTFDGDVEKYENVPFEIDSDTGNVRVYYVKIADEYYEPSQLAGAEACAILNGKEYSVAITEDLVAKFIGDIKELIPIAADDSGYMFQELLLFIKEPITIPAGEPPYDFEIVLSRGIWTIYRIIDQIYYKSLTITGEEQVKQLDEKFIPDTIATKEYVHQLLGTNIEDIASLIGGDA